MRMRNYLLTMGISAALALSQPAAAATVYQLSEAILGDDGVQRIEVLADSYSFRPNYLVVKAGVPLELTLRRQTLLVPHDFILALPPDNIHIEQEISREGTILRLTPSTPGQYPFHCGKKLLFFESHRDQGMAGMLEVR